jgi:hypothetical protein
MATKIMVRKKSVAKKKTFWLSFDLGIKGDYNGIYTWLDKLKAKECGDSLAVFQRASSEDHINKIKQELEKNVKLRQSDRVYVIWLDGLKVKGQFIFGNRKPAPWEGFAPSRGGEIIDY